MSVLCIVAFVLTKWLCREVMLILTQDLCRFATYACGVPFACGLPLQKSVSMGHHSNSLGTILYLDQYTRIVYYHICYSDTQVIKVQINLDE